MGTYAQPIRDAWHEEIAARLAARDLSALMELYDHAAQLIYGYALRATRSRRSAYEFTRDAFLTVWQNPDLLRDARVPADVRLTALAHCAIHEMDGRGPKT